jgi:hypothetical protein
MVHMGARSIRRRGITAVIAAVLAMGACDKDEPESTTMAWQPEGSASGGDSEGGSGSGDASASTSPGDGSPCTDDCTTPPGDCFEDDGVCEDGQCVAAPLLAGEVCNDGCDGGGFCDATGNCICVENCAATCTAGEHATAACDEQGMCVRTCEAPWDNCDGDWANGCEVPVGVAHQCDSNGLNPNGGCWTAYCGSAQGEGVHDFGTYHCVDCSTCGEPGGGQCHWCNHDTGNFFPQEACSCGAEFLNLACGPV